MNKIYFPFFLMFFCIYLQPNEINFNFRQNSGDQYLNNFISTESFTFSEKNIAFMAAKEKIRIFDKPDLSWIKEKNRMEKLFIGIGAVSLTIGFSMFLAGLLNLVVPFDAVSVDGVAIEKVRNTYIAVLATGSGLMVAGVPFVIVGSVRIGIQKKKDKTAHEKKEDENPKKEKNPEKQ